MVINEIRTAGINSLYGIANEFSRRGLPAIYGRAIWRGFTVNRIERLGASLKE